MKIFLIVLILIFGHQSLTRADDISDFEIENLSIGDPLINYMTKNEITSDFSFVYKDKSFATIFYNKKTQYSSKVRRFYRNKDFTENAIKKMNNNFKKLMLEKYLNNKSKIDKKFKINYHFI